jgi:hypothetical protein
VRSLLKEMVMAVRIIALLIPLAITLPYLQTNSPPAAAPPVPVALVHLDSPPAWSREARRVADVAVERVVLESPTLVPTHKASVSHAARRSTRLTSSAKAATTAKAPMPSVQRHAKRAPLQPHCQPFVHCAPVVVGKVTPVSGRPM